MSELPPGAQSWMDDAYDELYKKMPNALTPEGQRQAAARIANKQRPMLAAIMAIMFLGAVAIVVGGIILVALIIAGAL